MLGKKTVLTGDRPSGNLHLGHYVGSLQSRLQLQEIHNQYILIADVQALTDNAQNPEKVRDNVFQVMLDYLAVGIDPKKSTIFVQSMIPQIAELTIFFLNLVTVSRLKRNPTVKSEIEQKGFKEAIPAGFLMYPVSQAADITIIKGQLIPVGEDQLPMIEQTNELVRTFNRFYGDVLVEAEPVLSKVPRLPGIDGKAKMGKSLGNAINLSDSEEELQKKVYAMYTDPNHIRVVDPGQVEGNVVFAYLDIFDQDQDEVKRLKEHYRRGGLGDMVIKKRLFEVLNEFLKPIRSKRLELAKDPEYVLQVLKEGTFKTLDVASKTMSQVKSVMKINYF